MSPSFSSKSEVLKCIKQEMAVFENLGERPKTLEMLFKALMTIPASSVESEQAFSAAGLFVSKLRTSLSDNSVDTVCCVLCVLICSRSEKNGPQLEIYTYEN